MNREFNIACMHAAKRPNSTKIKSAKTFLKAFLRKFIPSKYTRYTVSVSQIFSKILDQAGRLV